MQQRAERTWHLTDLNVEEDLVGDGRPLLLGLGATHYDGTAERGGHGELGEHFDGQITARKLLEKCKDGADETTIDELPRFSEPKNIRLWQNTR